MKIFFTVLLFGAGMTVMGADLCTLEGKISRDQTVIARPVVKFEVGKMGRVETGDYCLNVLSQTAPQGVMLDLRVRVDGILITPKVLVEPGKSFSVDEKGKPLSFRGKLNCLK